MIELWYPFLFLFGAGVGSFLNVVSMRYRPEGRLFGKSIMSGRSECDHCKKKLRWFELLPLVSFLLQGGKCRRCKKTLSLSHPLVEIVCGAIALGVPLFLNAFYGIRGESFFMLREPGWYYALVAIWSLFFLILLLMSLIDWKHYVIPDGLNISIGLLGVLVVIIKAAHSAELTMFKASFLRHYSLVFSPFENIVANHILGACVGVVFFGALVVLSKGYAMGLGDVKLALVTGLLFGWPDIGLIMIFSFMLGGTWGALLLIRNKKGMKDMIPFGPFFALGSALTFFFGYPLIKGYFDLFQL